VLKAGQPLAVLVPDTMQTVVELWVNGNDMPLLHIGDKTRLQFEGWPAIQFVGWPSVAVGTFGGEVMLIDATDDGTGRFRVLVAPEEAEEPWPSSRYLRQGVRANGWVLLKQVPLGFELWRRFNGFPPTASKGGEQSKEGPQKK
jgi:adhesin transport system membrane fusion protein